MCLSYSWIDSQKKYLLINYPAPDTVLCALISSVEKQTKISALMEFTFWENLHKTVNKERKRANYIEHGSIKLYTAW